MPPPSVTPSPHRFVIKKEPQGRVPLAQEQTPRPSTQQFKATPRFNFSSTPGPAHSQSLVTSAPAATRLFTPARPTSRQEEIIDTFSDSQLHDSIESEHQDIDAEFLSGDSEDDFTIEERGFKQQRISSTSALLGKDAAIKYDENPEAGLDPTSSPLPILSTIAPRRSVSKAAPRFIISTPAPLDTTQSTQAAFLKPPRFRPPDPSGEEQSQTDPLPDQFSPHRRGQKYITGGLAAEVRDWLINLETTTPVSATKKSKDDPWLLRLLVDGISGGGKAEMTLVTGRQVHFAGGGVVDSLGILKIILAGEGAGTGLQKGSRVEVGKVVGIKGPVWEVMIDQEKWGVGVDWKVLQ